MTRMMELKTPYPDSAALLGMSSNTEKLKKFFLSHSELKVDKRSLFSLHEEPDGGDEEDVHEPARPAGFAVAHFFEGVEVGAAGPLGEEEDGDEEHAQQGAGEVIYFRKGKEGL